MNPILQDPKLLQELHSSLLSWYFKNGRLDLPWRNLKGQVPVPHANVAHIERDYGVYISEMMLQQTQVSVVLERFYFPFLERFPSLSSLADSKEEEVLKLWQGLGYYSRARNLRKTALICKELYGGNLPPSREQLKKLSGIGEYSSGAIMCFGFGESVSFVDGNIARVISRLFALPQASGRLLEQIAHALLNRLDSFNHNQALLDLGATLCTPRNPNCLFCPLASFCLGKSSPLLYPTPKKREILPLKLNLGFFQKNGKISLCKSQSKLYHGLYNPISLENLEDTKFLGSFSHHYTKYAIRADVYLCLSQPSSEIEFFSLAEIASLPISNLCKKALKCLSLT
ncbi:A/G-specific adenine glycosylase [Helicobacter pametensis]|nr:A/G-specific adenine glycosylase [Helicobacter pametensis]